MLMEKTKNKLMNEEIMQPKHHYRNDNEVRIAVLENSVSHIFQSLERIEKNIEKGFSSIDDRFKKMDEKIDKVTNRLWTIFLWLLTVMSTFSTGLLITMATGFHWIGG